MSLIYLLITFLFPLKMAIVCAAAAVVLAVIGKSNIRYDWKEKVFLLAALFVLQEIIHLSYKIKVSHLNDDLHVALTALGYVGISIFSHFIKSKRNLIGYCVGISLIFANVCWSFMDTINIIPLFISFFCAIGVIYYLAKKRISTEQHVAESKKRLEDILKTFPEALFEFTDGKVERLNKSDLVIDEKFNEFLVNMESSQDFEVEKEFSNETGLYSVVMRKMTHRSGHTVFVKDVTDKVSKEKELENNKIQLLNSSKLAALGEMAGGVAHEINNPLQILALSIEQMRLFFMTDDVNKDECSNLCDQMEGTVERINNIVKGMKVISRDGNDDPFEMVDASEIVNETLKLCKEKFKNSGVKLFVYKEKCEDYSILAQQVRLSQVVLNILNNAFDAISDRNSKVIRVSLTQEPGNVVISFSDNGPGVPQDLADKVFQPFFTTKEIGKGTGLGLSISKGIVEQHSGEFILDPTERSKFIIKIPSIKEEQHVA